MCHHGCNRAGQGGGALTPLSFARYVAFQFVKAALFMIHLLVLLVQCTTEVSFLNVVQWVGSTLIGVHYYLNAWHPAMMEQPPLLGFKYYAFYMYCFFMCAAPLRDLLAV